MSFKSIFFIFCCILSCSAQGVHAQTLTNVTAISFGEMVVGGTGDVTIPSNIDSRSATGSVALVGSALVERGRIDITFTPGAQVVITLPSSIAMIGANTPNLTPTVEGGTVQTIPPGGTLTVFFGGTVTFTAFGATGVTSGVITVQVDPL